VRDGTSRSWLGYSCTVPLSPPDPVPCAAVSERLVEDWRVLGIRLAVGDVVLEAVREHDLAELCRILPDDVEHDPTSAMWSRLDLAANRRRLFLQSYWRTLATWSADCWALYFKVTTDGRTVGVQVLEGEHFPDLRTVDSASWIVPDARGRGIGVAMRTAVLALAFDHLGAAHAVSSAREENVASLGVSRRIGYVDNGVSRSLSPTGPCTLRHMLLSRERWVSSGLGSAVSTSGLSGTEPWFGVEVSP
jgi:RimJ/RimL family protein N-acetyltransferase